MTQQVEVEHILQQTIVDYAKDEAWEAMVYPICDPVRKSYALVQIPNNPRSSPPAVIVMARLEANIIIIEEDSTDRPLVDELVRAGIPRARMILRYAGEQVAE